MVETHPSATVELELLVGLTPGFSAENLPLAEQPCDGSKVGMVNQWKVGSNKLVLVIDWYYGCS